MRWRFVCKPWRHRPSLFGFAFIFGPDGTYMSDASLRTDDKGLNVVLKYVDKAGASEPVSVPTVTFTPDGYLLEQNVSADGLTRQIVPNPTQPATPTYPTDVTVEWSAEGDPVPGVDKIKITKVVTINHAEAVSGDAILTPIT